MFEPSSTIFHAPIHRHIFFFFSSFNRNHAQGKKSNIPRINKPRARVSAGSSVRMERIRGLNRGRETASKRSSRFEIRTSDFYRFHRRFISLKNLPKFTAFEFRNRFHTLFGTKFRRFFLTKEGGGGFKGISWTTRERGTKHDDKTCILNTRLSSFHGSLLKKSRSKKTIVTGRASLI